MLGFSVGLFFFLQISIGSVKAAVVTTNAPISIVTLRAGVNPDNFVAEFRLAPTHVYHHALNGFAAPTDASAITGLRQDPRVLAVEADGEFILHSQTFPTGIIRMGVTNFPVAHINGMDNRINVDVAVMDSGIQTNHPDLNVFQAVDCTGSGLNGNDWLGHGTHVAGIIGALDNDFGVVGVAPGVRLWSVQVVGTHSTAWSEFIAGCDFISAHADKISVVNASLGGSTFNSNPYIAVHFAVSNLVSQGIVFVASAGNSFSDITGDDGEFGTPDDIIPAAFSEVMAVSAMDPTNDTIWTSSNGSSLPKSPSYVNSPGLAIDLAAPGVNILSTYIGGSYITGTGTSAAAPHVAGLVALYIAANGRATNAAGVYKIRQAIVDNGQSQSSWQPPYYAPWGCYCTLDPDGNPEPLAMPSEKWVPQPKILAVSPTVPGAQVSFQTVPGYTYTVQYCNSLAPSNQWSNLTSTNGNGSLTTVTVSDSTPSTARFYRLSRQPTP